jgi:hypothetical protein
VVEQAFPATGAFTVSDRFELFLVIDGDSGIAETAANEALKLFEKAGLTLVNAEASVMDGDHAVPTDWTDWDGEADYVVRVQRP